MASGHANRVNRPNTWLHRPATRREVLTCQPGAVHTWHYSEVVTATIGRLLTSPKRSPRFNRKQLRNGTDVLQPSGHQEFAGRWQGVHEAIDCAQAREAASMFDSKEWRIACWGLNLNEEVFQTEIRLKSPI